MIRALCLLAAFTSAVPVLAAEWPSLADPPREADRPGRKDAALIIAIEDYLLVDDVPGARANAADWDRWFDARGVPVARVVVLRDAEAVRESILRQAAQLAQEVPAGGTLWVVYIGHGAPSADGKDGVLVGADAQQKAEILYARSVGRQELVAALKGKQAETVLVLDACFSGRGSGGKALVPGLQPLVPAAIQATPRVTILSAGAGDEFAGPLPGASRPAFSYLTLGALSGWREADGDDDGSITLAEAVAYSRGALRRVATDRKQTPEIIGPMTGMKIARAARTGPDLRGGEAERAPPAEIPVVEAPRAAPPRTNQASPNVATPGPGEAPVAAVAVHRGRQRFVGRYLCGQGWTDMVLEIRAWPSDREVQGTFSFHYKPKDIQGAFEVVGIYRPGEGELTFSGTRWLKQPPNYSTVGMVGQLTDGGRRYTGRILDPACEGFVLTREAP